MRPVDTIQDIKAIGHEPALGCKKPVRVDGRHMALSGRGDYPLTMIDQIGVRHGCKPTIDLASCADRLLDLGGALNACRFGGDPDR
jgi:hypothetical protein